MKKNPLNRPRLSNLAIAALLGVMLVFAATRVLKAEEPGKANRTYPKVVLIIRHGEKPDDDKLPGLSDQGKQRAKALHKLFKPSKERPHPFPTPDFIFATHNTEKSHRPVDTVKPLAKSLKLTINDKFHNKEEDKGKGKGMSDLKKELFGDKKYQGKTILICWHHGTIPHLAKLLGATGYPDPFKKKEFDRVWQLTYDKKGVVTFADLPQQLLPADTTK